MKNLPANFAVVGTALAAVVVSVAFHAESQQSKAAITFLNQRFAAADIQLGKELYAGNCASCHGVELEGQPNWQRRLENGRMPAPPHDESGHTWHHSDRVLFEITKGGVGAIVPNYESDMPAFEGMLTDDEIRTILAFIKSTWPERQRAFQDGVSENDGGGS